jgi:hypothetical protein
MACNEAILFRRTQEGPGGDDLPSPSQHSDQKLPALSTSPEGDNGLEVQDEPVIIQCLAHTPYPCQGVQLTVYTQPFGLLFGDVSEHDHGTVN